MTENPKRWVVTGGSRGIGLAIARAAAARGHRVALLARGDASETARSLGDLAVAVKLDVSDSAAVDAAIGTLAEQWGGFDVVVNNAGLHRGGLVDALPLGHWNDVLSTNLFGPFHIIRAVVPHMDAGSSIVNIGAVVGFRGFAGDAPYAASKAGLSGLNYALAVELARRGIRVNMVVPGMVATEMTANISERAHRRLVSRIPLGREGLHTEIADVVHWVAGSTYMTGAVVPVDGGLLAQF